MRNRMSGALKDAQVFYRLLLYEATNGSIGQAPEKVQENQTMTFGEKRGLLDSIIKIAEIQRRSKEGQEQESGFDLIRKGINAGREDRYRGNDGASADGATNDESDSEDTEAAEES